MGEKEIRSMQIKRTVMPYGEELRFEFEQIADYTGEVVDGVPSGKGKCVFEDRDYYEGNWVDGKMCGQGIYNAGRHFVLLFDKHWTYEGEFENDMFNGHGIQKSEKGWVYDGQWKDGRRHGDGVYTDRGTVYKGKWEHNFMTGQGVCESASHLLAVRRDR